MTERLDHLDPATIAALVDRTLDPAARAAAEAHLAACANCREVWVETSEMAEEMTGAASTGAATPPANVVPHRPRSRRWIYGGAGIAAAAAIAVAVLSPALFNRGDRPELRELVEAVGDNRRTEGRLTGGFKWGPVPSAMRGGLRDPETSAAADVAIASLRLEAEQASDDASSLAALGTGLVAVGRLDAGIQALEEATTQDPNSAQAWSDLAAAYVARGTYPGRGVDVPRALEAARRALRLKPVLLEAQFNEALALERLGLAEEADAAWARYLDAEKDPAWRREAETRRQALARPPSPARLDAQPLRERLFDVLLPEWARLTTSDRASADRALATARAHAARLDVIQEDRLAADVIGALGSFAPQPSVAATLAAGHAAYGRGRDAFKRDRFEDALPELERAERLLQQAASPLRFHATLQIALVRYRQERHREAAVLLDRLLTESRGQPYPSLHGRVRWTRGLILGLAGDRRSQVAMYRQAREDFERAAEPTNVGAALSLMATSYERLGEPARSWDARVQALARSPREGVLLVAASSALKLEWLEVADALQGAAAARARAAGRLPNVADALRSQAATAAAKGDRDRARALLEDARAAMTGITGAAWQRISNEIDITAAQIGDTGAALAADRATRYLEISGAKARLPELHLARARLLKDAGEIAGARAAARAGLELYTELRHGLPDGDAGATFGDAMRRLVALAVSLEVDSGNPEEGLAVLERSRAQDLGMANAEGFTIPDLQRRIPVGTQVVEYLVGERETLVWVMDAARVTFARSAVGRHDLRRLVDAASMPRFDRAAGQRLHAMLIEPVAAALASENTLVIVADGPLHQLPFAALPGADGRVLVEGHPIVIAPSARASVQRGRTSNADLIIAIGDPIFDPTAFPDLPTLPHAAQEAVLVRSEYGRGDALTGAAADRDAVLGALSSGRVMHFAGHAVVNEMVPGESMLVTSGGGRHGIRASEIRQLNLSSTPLVVLAACQSNGGFRTDSEGPLGLARAFLSAGVPSVVASRWPLSDRGSRELLLQFHREWRATGNAAQALRRAQVAAIRASQGKSNEWAGLAVFGASL